MARAVSPEDMRDFLASGNVNKRRNRRTNTTTANLLAATLVESDPEMAQVVTAAALCYAARHVDEFAADTELNKSETDSVRVWLKSLSMLATNGATAMKTIREVFGD